MLKDKVADFLNEPKDKPFCLVIATNAPHAPFVEMWPRGGSPPARSMIESRRCARPIPDARQVPPASGPRWTNCVAM
jgi:hypothetical protein